MIEKFTPLELYKKDLNELNFTDDQAQLEAIKKLDDLYVRLELALNKKHNFLFKSENILKSLFFVKKSKSVITGLYLWGGVGRGKTYLMDIFFNALHTKSKLRIHFHRFMREIHNELSLLKSKKNPLKLIAKNISKNIDVICFDEFFVNDIADAMILNGVFEELFNNGVCLVATSNVHPDFLYNDGLQRQKFIPSIDLIKKYTEIHHLDGNKDYRLKTLERTKLFYYPLSVESDKSLLSTFNKLAPHTERIFENPHKKFSITINGRKIPVKFVFDDLVWFNFSDLCGGPRSQIDYIEIAKEFHTVFLSGLPKFHSESEDLARRFIYLIDIFYDRKIKLIVSSEVAIHDLYTEEKMFFEFQRTLSRLQEMQSNTYLGIPHKS